MRLKKVVATFSAIFLLSPVALLPAAESTLRVCDDVEQPASLDPFQIFSEKTITIMQQALEGLLRFDPDGKIEPALAESWERLDDRTVRFHLRKGVVFHNGEPFDAQSVKFSLERYVNPETKYPGFGFVGTISSVNIVDSYTVDVLTHIPDGLLFNRLAAFCQIVPAKYYKEVGPEAFGKSPVGTGPFKFESWSPKVSITFSANKAYWMAGHPKITKLMFLFIPAEKQMQSLLAGGVDLVTDLPGTMTLHVLENGPTRIIKRASFYTYGGSLNISEGPLSDVRVRKAINMAIDREEIIRYDTIANGIILATLSMPGQTGFNSSLSPYPYNVARAKELLKEAGYPNGFSLNVFVKSQGKRAFQIIQKQLESINVVLKGEVVTDAEMFQKLSEKKWDIVFGNCPDPMAHSYFIQAILLYSKSPFSVHKNEEYDRQLEAMAQTTDLKKQEELGQKIEKYVYDNALGLPTYQRVRTYGMKRNLYFTPAVTAMLYFHSAYFGKPVERRALEIK